MEVSTSSLGTAEKSSETGKGSVDGGKKEKEKDRDVFTDGLQHNRDVFTDGLQHNWDGTLPIDTLSVCAKQMKVVLIYICLQ